MDFSRIHIYGPSFYVSLKVINTNIETVNCLIIHTFRFYALEDYLKLHHNCLAIAMYRIILSQLGLQVSNRRSDRDIYNLAEELVTLPDL